LQFYTVATFAIGYIPSNSYPVTLFLSRIAMGSSAVIFLGILISTSLVSAATKDLNPPQRDTSTAQFIKTSCDLTQYPALCVSSLSSFPGSLKPTLTDMAKATANVSLGHVRNATNWISSQKGRSPNLSEPEKAALENCIQNFNDIKDELRESLAALKHLRRNTFDAQMDDVLSGMNQAFTNEDSCRSGFKGVDGHVKLQVTDRVQNVHAFIANSLALFSAVAATGADGNAIEV